MPYCSSKNKHMQKNVKISEIDKKRNKPLKTKKTANVLYLLGKCLKVKVHKMLRCQSNNYLCTSFYLDSAISSTLQA